MEIYLIGLAVAMIGGLMMSRVTKLLHLPAVTAYLVAGLLLGPYCIGALKVPGMGFSSLEQVESLGILTKMALGFIAFSMGSEFRLSHLKGFGSKAITIGICQAVVTTLIVDIALILLHIFFPEMLSLSAAITLGAIASATAPAATLMVIKQYKAEGPLTRLLLLVVAIDDAVGLLLPGPGRYYGLPAVSGGAVLPFPQQAYVHCCGFRPVGCGHEHAEVYPGRYSLRLLPAAGVHDDRHCILQHL